MPKHPEPLSLTSTRVRLLLACALVSWAGAASGRRPACGAAQTPRQVVATVEGREIPERLFKMYFENGRNALGLDARTPEGRRKLELLREGVVSELIDRELIRQEAERRGLRPDAERAAAEERRALEQRGGEDGLREYLAARGLTREEFSEAVLAPLYGELLRRELGKGLRVTDAEVRAFYDAHRGDAEFRVPERVAASHVLFAARPALIERRLREEKGLAGDALRSAVAEELARRRARAEQARLSLGPRPRAEEFAALARADSDDAGTRVRGGSLGLFARGSHPKAFDDAAFSLRPGELSEVVETEFGFHLIRLERREPARALTYEEAAPEIRRRLLAAREAGALKSWLSGARRSARIRVAEAFRVGTLRAEFPAL